jgi:hypothetical protein
MNSLSASLVFDTGEKFIDNLYNMSQPDEIRKSVLSPRWIVQHPAYQPQRLLQLCLPDC